MRIGLFIFLLLPLGYLSAELFYFQSAIDPIKYIYTFTGVMGIILLFATTTISLIKRKINLMSYRRQIGLFAFFYAFLHLSNFIVLDAQFDMNFVIKESLDKPFIYLGMSAFFILLFMAVTSVPKWYAQYYPYHKAIYVVLLLVTIHFIMAQKSLSQAQYGYLFVIAIIAFFKLKQRVKF
ncbi:MAG: ferric reductase-like transmembrane domain-containing protein [Arcobacteraceae bacterium]|jgi:sulfoxide reductase heme-binding subunit YedZ|nr:ferric reductase-like transmembrane domain-containing protein [Arcobacteraceae bacterium]